MNNESRILCKRLQDRIMSADQAASLVFSGANVGMSGFTGSGYPKAIPVALAERIEKANRDGQKFKIGVWTGASTAPELDGAWPGLTAWNCAFRTSPILPAANASTPAKWNISIFTFPM